MNLRASGINWGDVPTTAQGVVALIALIFSAFALVYSKNLSVNDSSRRTDEMTDRERQQANLVACWPTADVEELGDDEDLRDYAFAGISCLVKNGSSQPIYNLYISFVYKGEVVHEAQIAVAPPDQITYEFLPQEVLGRVSKLADNFEVPMNIHEARRISNYEADNFQIQMNFVDVNQRNWHRGSLGLLTKIE